MQQEIAASRMMFGQIGSGRRVTAIEIETALRHFANAVYRARNINRVARAGQYIEKTDRDYLVPIADTALSEVDNLTVDIARDLARRMGAGSSQKNG